MDTLYPQDNGQGAASEWIVRTQLVKQLRQPQPFDLDDVDLKEYKGVKPPYDSWAHVEQQCTKLSMDLLAKFSQMLEHSNSHEAKTAKVDLKEWTTATDRGEKPPVSKLPGLIR